MTPAFSLLRSGLAAGLAALFPSVLWAALPYAPAEDLHFMAEHLAEAAQDSRFFALPWPSGDTKTSGWRPLVAVGRTSIDGGYAKVGGDLVTVGASHAGPGPWSFGLLAFDDRLDVSGGISVDVLGPSGVPGVPLDLPEIAEFSGARGRIHHNGVGLVVTHARGRESGEHPWDLVGGILLERLALKDYSVHYRLLTGANAGAEGTVDHSGTSDFVNLFIGAQTTQAMGPRFLLVPRVSLGAPLPVGKFSTHFTGPGFDLSTESTGAAGGRIGDMYLTVGLGVRDRDTGLEFDLGAVMGFPLFERLSHEGITRAMLLSVVWRGW